VDIRAGLLVLVVWHLGSFLIVKLRLLLPGDGSLLPVSTGSSETIGVVMNLALTAPLG
jgi:hypothetical protein